MSKKNESTKLVERVELKNSPFVAVKIDTKTWILTLGKYRVCTSIFETWEQVDEYVNSKPWDLLMQTINVIVETISTVNNTKN